jgi:hypothetical protein
MATDDGLVDAVERWMVAYPEVDVQWRFPTGAVVGAVVAETAGATLTVLGAARHRRLRGSMAADIQRLARGPVVLVATGAAAQTPRRASVQQTAPKGGF